MKVYRGIGLMSGTSLDGIDLAFCEFKESSGKWTFDLLVGETVPMDEMWQSRLVHLDQVDARTFARTHVYWGHHLGKTVAEFIQRYELNPQYVASHGQTIFHEPERNYTTQIGDGETMVTYLSCPLVCNFRNKDVAIGGQGAPLVPFGEQVLWPEVDLFLNLGGIANLSRVGDEGEVKAFDVAVANMAMNWLSRQLTPALAYDAGGNIARGGQVHSDLLHALDQLDYYKQSGPKSLGTEWFESNLLPLLQNSTLSLQDRLHTYAKHLVGQIEASVLQLKGTGGTLLVTGGGARNTFLMEILEDTLSKHGVTLVATTDEVIDFKEAIIFALLGLKTLLGQPNTLPAVTGGRQAVPGGSIHLPIQGWKKLL